MPVLNVVGAGRLGRSLARLLRCSGAVEVGGVYCRSAAAAQEAVAFIGGGCAVATLDALPDAELTLIAVPDGVIGPVASALASAVVFRPGSVAFHASGVGEASLLVPLAAQGVRVASVHPAFSFAEPARAVEGFAGTLCALEGDALACDGLEPLVRAMGGRPFRLAPGGKAAYHAALSIASNYLVTLNALALDVARAGGVGEALGRELVGRLMQQTLANVLALGAEAALTGPIARGDAGTLGLHRACLSPAQDAAYCALGRLTVALAAPRLAAGAQAQLEHQLQSRE